jgi:hypothetical protein
VGLNWEETLTLGESVHAGRSFHAASSGSLTNKQIESVFCSVIAYGFEAFEAFTS